MAKQTKVKLVKKNKKNKNKPPKKKIVLLEYNTRWAKREGKIKRKKKKKKGENEKTPRPKDNRPL